MNASHDAYVTGSPALYSAFVQPSVVFLAILQLDVMRVAGAVYSATYDEGSCEQDMSDPVYKCSLLYDGRSSKTASSNGVMSSFFTRSRLGMAASRLKANHDLRINARPDEDSAQEPCREAYNTESCIYSGF